MSARRLRPTLASVTIASVRGANVVCWALFGSAVMSYLSPECTPKLTPPTTLNLWIHALDQIAADRDGHTRADLTRRANQKTCPALARKI